MRFWPEELKPNPSFYPLNRDLSVKIEPCYRFYFYLLPVMNVLLNWNQKGEKWDI